MTDLLKRWAKAEPERCGLRGSFALVKLSGTEHSILSTGLLSSESAVVLAAVVESIEARGWTFSAHTSTVTRLADGNMEGLIVDRGYGATVFTWSDGKPNSMGPAYSSLDEPVATVAAALLAAYVAALEAEADQ